MTATKDSYRRLCGEEISIPIFSRDWWLDAAAGDENWDVVTVKEGGRIVAALPYVARKQFGFTVLTQPPLTQTLGPWLRSRDAKYAKRLAREKDLLQALVDSLPPFHWYVQNWHYRQDNWLPWHWRGFEQTTRYTYVLRELTDTESIWSEFRPGVRTDIRKAEDRFRIRVREAKSVEEFYGINVKTFERQGTNITYSLETVHRIDDACKVRNARRTFLAEDDYGRVHAGVYIVWDENSAYYLMGGSDPDLRNSGANSLCMWEAIKFSSKVVAHFDFEGSMIEPIERFFRAFGAAQTPYFRVSKFNSRLLRAAVCGKHLL